MFLMGINKDIFMLSISNTIIDLTKVYNQLTILVLVVNSLAKHTPDLHESFLTKCRLEFFSNHGSRGLDGATIGITIFSFVYIGTKSLINPFLQNQLVNFYQTWYESFLVEANSSVFRIKGQVYFKGRWSQQQQSHKNKMGSCKNFLKNHCTRKV
jgi:hypothetical protein